MKSLNEVIVSLNLIYVQFNAFAELFLQQNATHITQT